MTAIADDEEERTGAPPWLATFADLMSLLLAFFVLLLSFSQMDVEKYKQVAGSMREAFGVQNQVQVMDIPKGTSIIAREFSPGETRPTLVDTVNQRTTETTKPSLRVGNPDAPRRDDADLSNTEASALLEQKLQSLTVQTQADAEKLRKLLQEHIDEGMIDIDTDKRTITVRIREKGSFPSGSASLHPDFRPVLAALREALGDIGGKISVEGHTDDIPISGNRYQSNWDLSASRALSVTHELTRSAALDESRFMVVGHAENKPFVPNDSWPNRALNRRVEIIIRQGLEDTASTTIDDLQQLNSDIIETLE